METKEQKTSTNKVSEETETETETEAETTSSSPSHEFSFTISAHSSETTAATTTTSPTVSSKTNLQAPLAIDLSPADEIFFHGHLLPLHFLSHLHAASSPRSSANSLDSFTLPITDILHQDEPKIDKVEHTTRRQTQNRAKPFSLFGLAKWRRGSETKEKTEKKKLKFDVSQLLKRYMKMVKPLLSTRAGRRENFGARKQSYSFSGTLSPRDYYGEIRGGRRGEFSAPASMRTSPTNSGLLIAKAENMPSPVSESTMEELQAAIQAAIAHCKNSVSVQDKSVQELSSVPVN